jgi:hypothetical protein
MNSKNKNHSEPSQVQHAPPSDDVQTALDQSEKEYNRMISQHMMHHRMLMDDLIKLTTETGSGSTRDMSLPRQLLQQKMDQAQQANTVQGLGTTIGNMNANRDKLMNSASKIAGKSSVNAQTVARLNQFIQQKGSALVKNLDSLDSLDSVDATATATATNKTAEGFANPAPNPTLDGALEVSALMRESHKYALIVAGVIAIYLLYKTTKNLRSQ